MPGIGEVVAQLHAGARKGAEAIAAFQRVHDDLHAALTALGESRDFIDMTNASVTSHTLAEYATLLESAHEMAAGMGAQIQTITQTIEEGQEMGEQYISRLYG